MNSENKLEIKGKLTAHSSAELLNEIAQAGLSGSLRLSNEKQKVIVYFDEGKIVFAVSNSREHRLFEILLREKLISKEQLTKIEGFAKDIQLTKTLADENTFPKESLDALSRSQIDLILGAITNWKGGDWIFNPLARIKEGIHFEIDLAKLLLNYGESLNADEIENRFKTMQESFSLNLSEVSSSTIKPTQEQAFILSRIGDQSRSIKEIVTLSDFKKADVFKILYSLWLSGMISRQNWTPQLNEADISKISSAKIALKTSAISFEKQHELEKEKKAKEEEEKAKEEAQKQAKEEENKQLSINEYIRRIDDAATHYEMFGVAPEASIKEIKKIYFSFAKKFHPDLYQKKVSESMHKKIQNAFTEIAGAYETIKDPKSREIYDFKLRKILEAYKNKTKDESSPSKETFEEHKDAERASEQFEKGYDLLLNERHNEALPFLARSVKLNDRIARYHAFYGRALSSEKKKRHVAESEIQNAIKLDPKNSLYRIMLIELYIKIGLDTRAKGELNRLLKNDPDNKDALLLLDRLEKK